MYKTTLCKLHMLVEADVSYEQKLNTWTSIGILCFVIYTSPAVSSVQNTVLKLVYWKYNIVWNLIGN